MKKRKRVTVAPWYERWLKANADYLDETEQQRFRTLSKNSSLSKPEEDERKTLVSMAGARRAIEQRFQIRRRFIQTAEEKLRNDPDNPEAQRAWLRELITPCFPNYAEVLAEMFARGDYPLQVQTPARQGLENVLYVMDYTMVADVLLDPDQRVTFLTNLTALLEPFRQLKFHRQERGKPPDLNHAFGFCAQGRGNRSRDRQDIDRSDWETPCFDLHLLNVSGVTVEAATARVANVHHRSFDTLRDQYKTWASHPVRKEWLRRGRTCAKQLLTDPHCQALLATAYPSHNR